ncbi:hypothetical protein RIF29_06234 [Crotalaria pallida]|uniref:DUF599 domain-containing protein n=1 Tax=Crotalaria pallida TaxID=3830 RepID=A0AAN9J384_CROPI
MEWRKYYLDMTLVPLGFFITIGYHVLVWHKSRTDPSATTIGINAQGRRLWVPSMLKDIEKKNILIAQSLRNVIMGSTLMATTSILLSAGLAAVISSTYSVKKPLDDFVYGAHGELMVALKYVTLLTTFLFSFFCHSLSIRFLNQLAILACTPQDAMSLVTPEYMIEIFERGITLNTVGNRIFYTALPLLLWIFGPVMVFLCYIAMLPMFYNLDFVSVSGKANVEVNGKREDYV